MKIEAVFQKIADFYDLGELSGPPKKLTGGRLHRAWRVDTAQGVYLFKQLIEKKDKLQSYRVAQAVAQVLQKKGLPVVRAIVNKNKDVIYSVDDRFFMVLPYIEGKVRLRNALASIHCEHMGVFLSAMHNAALDLPDGPVWAYSYDPDEWSGYLATVTAHKLPIESLLKSAMPDIAQCYGAYQAHEKKGWNEIAVIGHRDLDPYNVIWTFDDIPHVIDWDVAGYIYPSVELMYVALGWSMTRYDQCDFQKFQAVIHAYKSRPHALKLSAEGAFYYVLANWLDWARHHLMRFNKTGKMTLAEQASAMAQVKNTLLSVQYIRTELSTIQSIW